MFVRGRAGTDGVTVAQVPENSGSWSALREHCDTWRAAVQAARAGVEEQQSTWGGMQAAYDEPETAATVHSAIDPLIDPAQLWASAVEQVAEAVESFASTAEALEAEADALQQRRPQMVQAARDVEDADADDDVDAERLQVQDFAWDGASLRHRWEQAQSGVAETIEQQSRVLGAVVLPQSAGSGPFSTAGFGLGFGAGAGLAIGSALFGGRGGAFDPSDVDVDLPPIPTTMSEEERRRYLEENSQALEDLMDVDLDELDDQTREQVESAIIRLAVPDVDPSDGESDAETVEEALSDEEMADEMAEAFGRSSEISDGLDSLEDWAASNEVDLEESEAVSGAMGYLGAFHRATYARRDEVTKYLEDGVRTGGLWPFTEEYEQAADDEQLETIRQGWADGLLTLSREDYGGGWDELPEGVREAAQKSVSPTGYRGFADLTDVLQHAASTSRPGDDLTVELARAAQHAMRLEEVSGRHDELQSPGVPESSLRHVFDLVGRNEAASAALLSGTDDVDGFEGTRFPEQHHPSVFVSTVFDHDWDDGGAAVASLIDWIGSDDGLSDRAEDAWYSLMETVTSVGDGGSSPDVFGQLMGGVDSSALEQNEVLAESFVRTTAANLDEIALADGSPSGELDDERHVRIMALATSNEKTAGLLSAEVQHYQAAVVAEGLGEGGDLEAAGQKVGILQGKYEGGVYAEARHSDVSQDEANARVFRMVQVGVDIVSSIFPNPATGIGDLAIGNLDVDFSTSETNSTFDGASPQYRLNLLRARTKVWLLESLGGESLDGVQNYAGPDAALPDRLFDNLHDSVQKDLREGEELNVNQLIPAYELTVQDDLDTFLGEKGLDISVQIEDFDEFVNNYYSGGSSTFSSDKFSSNVLSKSLRDD
ncbi:hypothetical protein GCM10020260_21150 [Nesterenkonia halobia]|uniref:TPR repeat domain-containing protein n=1 Tax=Nesterenkonia halobia TaxID=37922 RepID=A0ABP6RDV8_9MICC